MKGEAEKQVISVFGPTAVGKTAYALALPETRSIASLHYTGFDIISADSRQIYQDIKIISGADIPTHLPANTKIHGIGILQANEDWSVAHFVKFAREIIADSLKNNRLPIIVGGTGLYHQQLFAPAPTLQIKPNAKLRASLNKLSLEKLQDKLEEINPQKWERMNNSDGNNPRRLVRAIEIASPSPVSPPEVPLHLVAREIFLTDTLDNIKQKISLRVQDRFAHGAIEEIKSLKVIKSQSRKPISPQLLSATGVGEIWDFVEGKISQEECLRRWALREFQYAKRQLTWAKRYGSG